MPIENLQAVVAGSGQVARATVVELHENGEILVEVPTEPPQRMVCDLLLTTDAPAVTLEPKDMVLALLPNSLDELGCVLGRVGGYRKPERAQELVIEAKKGLTLNCGKSTISMRNDGKLMLKGVDIVSRAKRNNKIKGGSVHIN